VPVVCLPEDLARRLAGELPPAVDVVVWNGVAPPPVGAERAEVWVPDFGWRADDTFADTLAAMPALRVIQLTSAGFDHLDGRVPAGLTLCNGRGIHGGSTAEWVLAVTLASLRDLPRFVRAADAGRWDYHATDELADKRVLIVGAGDLGQQTARRLVGFDAEPVLVARSARAGVHAVTELAELLPTADVVVIVVPKNDDTIHLVDAAFLARMRDGALLVNAARGPVVDTDALVAELVSGRLHAALDVTDPEPLPAGHPLWSAPNLLLTPHVGGSVAGFQRRAAVLVADQVRRFTAGEPLRNVVS
jgi:phosphoglycerate dehydrogenase-like enzyme